MSELDDDDIVMQLRLLSGIVRQLEKLEDVGEWPADQRARRFAYWRLYAASKLIWDVMLRVERSKPWGRPKPRLRLVHSGPGPRPERAP